MSLTLSLTWPIQTDIPVDVLPCCERALVNADTRVNSGLLHVDGAVVRVQGLFDDDKLVRDSDSFRIQMAGATMALAPRQDVLLAGDARLPARHYRSTLVVLLESPHRDEYSPDLVPIAPAQGTTGNNLRRRLIDVINANGELSDAVRNRLPARVVLCNPIQFQASIHATYAIRRGRPRLCKPCRHGLTRAVWRAIWSVDEVRDDFQARLERYDASWILNACVHDGYLDWVVGSFLDDSGLDAMKYRTVHPVRWQERWHAWCRPL